MYGVKADHEKTRDELIMELEQLHHATNALLERYEEALALSGQMGHAELTACLEPGFRDEVNDSRFTNLLAARELADAQNRELIDFVDRIDAEMQKSLTASNELILQACALTGLDEDHMAYIKLMGLSNFRTNNAWRDFITAVNIIFQRVTVTMSEILVSDFLANIHTRLISENDYYYDSLTLKEQASPENAVMMTDPVLLGLIIITLIKCSMRQIRHGSLKFGLTSAIDSSLGGTAGPVFFVRCTGPLSPGFSEVKIMQLFSRENRSDEFTLNDDLVLASACMEMLGGTLRLESEQGDSHVFYLSIPSAADPD